MIINTILINSGRIGQEIAHIKRTFAQFCGYTITLNYAFVNQMKPSKLPSGVSKISFIPEDVIPASKGWVCAEAINIIGRLRHFIVNSINYLRSFWQGNVHKSVL